MGTQVSEISHINEKLYEDFTNHLLYNDTPSQYFTQLFDEHIFKEPPLDLLYKLKHTEQSQKHHPEGNAWNHTMMVVDEAAKLRNQSENPEAYMWAALTHDIGKPAATKNKNGKITAYNHDKVGARIVAEFMGQLTDNENLIKAVAALVRWHMQILYVVKGLPFAEITTMKQEVNLDEVALLGLADRLGRSNADMEIEEENIKEFLLKCKE